MLECRSGTYGVLYAHIGTVDDRVLPSGHVTGQQALHRQQVQEGKEATSFTVGNLSRLIPSQLRFIFLTVGRTAIRPYLQTDRSLRYRDAATVDLDPEAPESVERVSF
jgi:hypothetical protein